MNSPYIMPNAYMGMNYFPPYMYPPKAMPQMPHMIPFPNYYGFQPNNINNNNKTMSQPMVMPMFFPFGMNQMNKNFQPTNINNSEKK